MTAPAYYWPPSGAAARGIALAPFGASGMIVADWTGLTVWPFFSTPGSVALASGTLLGLGAAAAITDGASGLYAIPFGGTATGASGAPFWHVANGGSVTQTAIYFDGQHPNTGLATVSGSQYFVQTTGDIEQYPNVLWAVFPSAPRSLAASGATAYTLLAAGGEVGTYAYGAVSTSGIALPAALANPSCLAVSGGSPLAVGGWAAAPTLTGAAALAGDPTYSSLMLGVASGSATLWSSASGNTDSWSVAQSVTGLANLSALAWVPNGVQALATDSASGVVQVLDYAGGVLSLAQTLALAGAGAIAALPSDTDALVCRPAANVVQPLTASAGTWSVSGTSLSLASPQSVVATGPGAAAVAFASGVAFLAQTGGIWSVAASAALAYPATLITADAFGRVYAAGSGAFAVFSAHTQVGSGTLASGAPSAMLIDSGRLVFAVPAASGLVVYGQTSASGWTQQAAVTGLPGLLALGSAGTTLFAGASAATTLFSFSGTPYQPQQIQAGALGVYNGSTWATGALGAGHYPTALAFDVSGNVRVACADNTLWTFTSGAAFAASGAVAPYTGQTTGTPMGFSALLASGAAVYAATSLAGVLAQVA